MYQVTSWIIFSFALSFWSSLGVAGPGGNGRCTLHEIEQMTQVERNRVSALLEISRKNWKGERSSRYIDANGRTVVARRPRISQFVERDTIAFDLFERGIRASQDSDSFKVAKIVSKDTRAGLMTTEFVKGRTLHDYLLDPAVSALDKRKAIRLFENRAARLVRSMQKNESANSILVFRRRSEAGFFEDRRVDGADFFEVHFRDAAELWSVDFPVDEMFMFLKTDNIVFDPKTGEMTIVSAV